MLTRSEVRDAAASHGLEPWADELAQAAQVAWALQPVGAEDARARSRIGGQPLLTGEDQWPADEHGVRMTLLAVIDLDEVPAVPPGWDDAPFSGRDGSGEVLQIFADLRDNPIGVGRAAAVISAGTVGPAEASPERTEVLAEHRVRLASALTLPETWVGIRDSQWDMSSKPAADFQRWFDTLVPDVGLDQMLGGHPRSLQDDVRVSAAFNAYHFFADHHDVTEPEAWTSLLRLSGDEALGIDIGDEDWRSVLVPKVDLDAGSWDRLICVPESS